jgi:phage tail tape-measure protein
VKLHAPPHTAGSGVGVGSIEGVTDGATLGETLGSTEGVTDGATLGETLGSTEGVTDGATLGETLGRTEGGTLGLPPQVEEKIWNDPHKLRLFVPPTQTSSTCPQPPAYAAAEA